MCPIGCLMSACVRTLVGFAAVMGRTLWQCCAIVRCISCDGKLTIHGGSQPDGSERDGIAVLSSRYERGKPHTLTLSRQSYPPEDGLGLCQAAGEVHDSAPEPLGLRAMGLRSGGGECSKGLPIEGEAHRGTFIDIERDRMGQ